MKNRILIKEIPKYVDKEVTIAGWMHKVRNLGKVAFVVLKDRSGFIQCVLDKNLIEEVKNLHVESVLKVKGTVAQSPDKKSFELHTQEVEVLVAVKELIPIEINKDEIDAHLDTILDHRSISLRHEKSKSIFKIQNTILHSFSDYLRSQDFSEFRTPVIQAAPSESGADVFEVAYGETKAYLAQSPQVYKQIMLGVFERAFCITPAFRAEKHNTSRHLNEFTQIDAEMAFINDYHEVLDVIQGFLAELVVNLKKNNKSDLDKFGVDIPKLPSKGIPKLKVREILEIIEERTGKSAKRDDLDLDPADELEISKYVVEKYDSDFVFALNYKKNKNFYTWNDPEVEDESLSFDVIFRGLEILSGTHRIHDYKLLKERMENQGLSLEYYQHYLEAFQFGIPSEGGFSFGLERMTMKILELTNVRFATLFPSDLDRIAGQRIKKENT